MTLTNTVKEHSFLAGFTDSQTAKVFALSEEVSFPENKLILSARERSPYFYLLLSGSVCVEVIGRACVVCIHSLGPGDPFGWSSLLDHHDPIFQVRARENCRRARTGE
jgi:CRP-like cAMP-binding protein